ncbi:MAG: hypothetical protein MK005_18965, partial [Alcanivorax sp.]|nr:hypothetical protein [Alcanivorax sp.]
SNSLEFELLDPQTNRITKSQHVKVLESALSGPGLTPAGRRAPPTVAASRVRLVPSLATANGKGEGAKECADDPQLGAAGT